LTRPRSALILSWMLSHPAAWAKRRLPLAAIVAWTVFLTYFTAARGVQNLFPLSVFDMYRAHAPEVVGRLIVVDRGDRPSELVEWHSFYCAPDRPVLRDLKACSGDPESRPIGYVIRDQQLHLDAHLSAEPDEDAEPITISMRSYRLVDRPGAPAFTDCVVATCTARHERSRPRR